MSQHSDQESMSGEVKAVSPGKALLVTLAFSIFVSVVSNLAPLSGSGSVLAFLPKLLFVLGILGLAMLKLPRLKRGYGEWLDGPLQDEHSDTRHKEV